MAARHGHKTALPYKGSSLSLLSKLTHQLQHFGLIEHLGDQIADVFPRATDQHLRCHETGDLQAGTR